MRKLYIYLVLCLFAANGRAQAPIANFTWSIPQATNQLHFIDNSLYLPTAWLWSFGDGAGSTLQHPVHTFAVAGQYQVCLTATNTSGSDQSCKTVTITINSNALIVSLPAGKEVCMGSLVDLVPQVQGGTPPYTYNWSATAGALSCYACSSVTAEVDQTSFYSVTVTDAVGDTAIASAQYTTTPGALPLQATMQHTNLDCNHTIDTALLSVVNGAAPFHVNWGDLNSSNGGSTQTHFYTQSGAYVVFITDSLGCLLSLTDSVKYLGLQETVQLTQPNCINETSGMLQVSAGNGTGPYQYLWNDGTTTATVTNLSPGNYTVTITDAAGCSAAFTHQLAPISGWGYYVVIDGTAANCGNNGTVKAQVVQGNSPFTYQWNNGAQTDSIAQVGAGTYHVTVTDALGCTATAYYGINSNCFSTISGSVFYDANFNCSRDNNEPGLAGITILASGNPFQFTTTDSNGYYSFQVSDTGTWTLSASTSSTGCQPVALCNNPTQQVHVSVPGVALPGNNFGYNNNSFDLEVFAISNSANPGFVKEYTVGAYNKTGVPYLSQAYISFAYDSALVYQSSLPAANHNPSTHTLTWLVDSLPAYPSGLVPVWAVPLHANFLVPATVSPSAVLHSNYAVYPIAGDCDTSSNFATSTEMVTGSLDPNAKDVLPAGVLSTSDSVLLYTIHFQNTGTDSTHFVIIRDTLSPLLDPATVRNVASSHPYSNFTISGSGVLTWTFNPLRLVDSLTDPVHSKGFVQFKIKRRTSVTQGAIHNRASIYFDYNTPVVTNTVSSMLAVAGGLPQVIGATVPSVQVFPNPAESYCLFSIKDFSQRYTIVLFDVTGKQIFEQRNVTTPYLRFERQGIAAGFYLYRVMDAEGRVTAGRVVFQ